MVKRVHEESVEVSIQKYRRSNAEDTRGQTKTCLDTKQNTGQKHHCQQATGGGWSQFFDNLKDDFEGISSSHFGTHTGNTAPNEKFYQTVLP